MLYELDLRLRPSGNKGPVATHVDAFSKYQRERGLDLGAHGADARARWSRGDAALAREVEAEVDGRPRPCRATAPRSAAEAAEMRALIEKEKPPRDIWDVKLVPGGLIDLEFIAQVAVLTGRVEGEAQGDRDGRDAGATVDPTSRTGRRVRTWSKPGRSTFR